ncbi:MAG: oligosaccharide flippase family protein [Sumerlaeia bacterium]
MASPFSALRWVLFGSIGFRILSFGGQMLILRLVEKDSFGAYRAIVQLHLIFLTLLPLGLDTLVVREKKFLKRYVAGTAGMLGIVGSVLAFAALLLALVPNPGSGSLLSRWMSLEEDGLALLLMPLIFAVQSAKLAIRSRHNAELNFRRISLGELGNGLITWLGGAIIVLVFPKAWALLGVYLLGELFEAIWFYRREPFRLGLSLGMRGWRIAWRLLQKHRAYCLFNTADMTLNNLASLIPGVLFAALISKAATADFAVASQVLVLPTMLMAGALWRVAFPSLSGLAEADLQRRCLSIISSASAFIAPSVLWFAVFASSNVYLLGGEEYMETAAPLVRWMGLYMVMVAVFNPISSLDMIRNRPEVGLVWNIFYTIGRVILVFTFASDGLLATVAALAIFSAAAWVVQIAIFNWLLGAGTGRFIHAFAPLLIPQALLLLGYTACLHLTNSHLLYSPLASLIPTALYMGIIWRFFPEQSAILHRLFKR